jgi:hypothetical protein
MLSIARFMLQGYATNPHDFNPFHGIKSLPKRPANIVENLYMHNRHSIA